MRAYAGLAGWWTSAFAMGVLGVFFAVGNVSAGTADHSKFVQLQQEFKSGQEVTQACLSCHNEAASLVMKTQHWT